MAKGSQLKEEIIAKILQTFPGSFKYDKEVRICGTEDGAPIQVKVTLTCAKVNVENSSGEQPVAFNEINFNDSNIGFDIPTNAPLEPTAEEKAKVESLIKQLNL